MIGSIIGEYRIVDPLGAGGMGVVYRAVHSRIGRVVAIKVLSESACDPSFIERFYNEARIQASLHHPNIAMLYEFLQVNNQPCIIMEFVEGETLTDRILASGSLQVPEALRIFQSIAEAIQYIHSQGIIHRDIKSNNVKIAPSGHVKLLDFGIAKSGSSPALTVTGGFVGTLQYLPPELFKGGQADARSDMWALGILLYEMVTGQMAFAASTLGELYEKVCKGAYVAAPLLNPAVPPQIESIVARCLKKRPSDRYQSASDLLEDVRRAVAEEVPAHRSGMTYVSTLIRLLTLAPVFKPERRAISSGPNEQSIHLPESKPGHRKRLSAIAGAVLATVVAYFLVSQLLSPTSEKREEKTVSVQLFGGPGEAQVYRDGSYVGVTPCELRANVRDEFELEFRLEGFVQREHMVVEPNQNIYRYRWKKND